MHDMGYLSQVGDASQSIRDANGVVKPGFETYVQKVRTPPLKGLRFNNYVTDAHRNTKNPGDPGCDFLLHDGRACSAIEAAFLHDGPAIKQLKVIEGLNALSADEDYAVARIPVFVIGEAAGGDGRHMSLREHTRRHADRCDEASLALSPPGALSPAAEHRRCVALACRRCR